MSRAGFSRKARTYIPKCRKSDPTPPIFTIRRLNPLEIQEISEKFSDANEEIELGGIAETGVGEGTPRTVKVKVSMLNKLVKAKYATLEKALSGWEHVEDENGEPIPFNKDNISCLDGDIISELSDVAQGAISEEVAKNSESPSV